MPVAIYVIQLTILSVRFTFLSQNHDLLSVDSELRKLTFENPGKFMENFKPEMSSREQRKLKQKMEKEKEKLVAVVVWERVLQGFHFLFLP